MAKQAATTYRQFQTFLGRDLKFPQEGMVNLTIKHLHPGFCQICKVGVQNVL